MKLKVFTSPLIALILMVIAAYWQFFILGKIPVPADTLVGAYYPWLDYKWGYPVGVPVKNPPISDVFSQFFVWKYLAVDISKQGMWPLWNPYSSSGTPLLATYHSAVANPFNLLLFLPKYAGWGLYIFSQTLLAAVGMYLLLSKFVNDVRARVAGSLVFSLSVLMTTWAEFGTGVYSASMLPWIFFFLISFRQSGRFRNLLFLTVAFTILYLSGHAQLTVYSTMLFFGYQLYNILHKETNRYQLLAPIFFWLISAGISTIQFLPAFDLTGSSVRADEAYSKTFNFGLNSWYEFIRLIAADFFGNPTTYNYWGSISYHEQTSFLGTLSLPFIIPLFFRRFRQKTTAFWLVIFLSSLLLALDNPLTKFLYSLPLPFLTYSSASRIFFITSFSAGVLVGFGFERYLTDERFGRYLSKAALAAAVIILAALSLVASGEGVTSLNLKVSLKNSILPAGLLISVILTRNFKKGAAYIFILLLFFDLGRYFLKYNPFVDAHIVFPKTPAIEFLQRQPAPFRISRIDQEVLPPNTWTAYGIESIEGYDPLSLEDYARYFNRLNGNQYQAGVGRYLEAKRFPSKFIDSLNAKYILAVKKEELDKTVRKDFEKAFEDNSTVIYKNPTASGLAYFTQKVRTVQDDSELITVINSDEFDPAKEAVVKTGDRLQTGTGEVDIVERTPNALMLNTTTVAPAFLVVAQSFDKGWNLFINGQTAKLYEVNGAIGGIMIPEGQSFIKLEYWPKSFDSGLKISVASLLILCAGNIYAVKKRMW